MIAKKDFEIFTNDLKLKIKEGTDLSLINLPENILQNLVTEGVVSAKTKKVQVKKSIETTEE